MFKVRLLESVDADEFFAWRYGEGFSRTVDEVCSHFCKDSEPSELVQTLEYCDALDMVGEKYYVRESADTFHVNIYEQVGNSEEQIKCNLWEQLAEGEITEEEWELQMWANGFLPDDHFSDDNDIPF